MRWALILKQRILCIIIWYRLEGVGKWQSKRRGVGVDVGREIYCRALAVLCSAKVHVSAGANHYCPMPLIPSHC